MNKKKSVSRWIALLLTMAMIFSSQAVNVLATTYVTVDDPENSGSDETNGEPKGTQNISAAKYEEVSIRFYEAKPEVKADAETEESGEPVVTGTLIGSVTVKVPQKSAVIETAPGKDGETGNTGETSETTGAPTENQDNGVSGTSPTESPDSGASTTPPAENADDGTQGTSPDENSDNGTPGTTVPETNADGNTTEEEIKQVTFAEVLEQFEAEHSDYSGFSWTSDDGVIGPEQLVEKTMDVWITPFTVTFYEQEPGTSTVESTGTQNSETTTGNGETQPISPAMSSGEEVSGDPNDAGSGETGANPDTTGQLSEIAAPGVIRQFENVSYGTPLSELIAEVETSYTKPEGAEWNLSGDRVVTSDLQIWPVVTEQAITVIVEGKEPKYFETLPDAVTAASEAKNGAEIILNKDISLSGLGQSKFSEYAGSYKYILDLKGHTIDVSGSSGRAICIVGGNVTIKNGVITGAKGSSTGMAVYIGNDKSKKPVLTMEHVTMRGNTSTNSSYGGGALSAYGEVTVRLNNCEISNNTAPLGGGITVYGSTGMANVTINGCIIKDNTSNKAAVNSGGGGGIYVTGGSSMSSAKTVTINDTVISGNIANRYGAGIYVSAQYSPVTLNNCQITNNRMTGGGSNYNLPVGGGIYFTGYNATLTVNDGSISGNIIEGSATANKSMGGGIAIGSGNTELNSVTIDGNTAGKGGGIYASGGTMTLNNVIVSNNTAAGTTASKAGTSGEGGGGIFVGSSVSLKMNGGSLSGNKAVSGFGNSIMFDNDAGMKSLILAPISIDLQGTTNDSESTETSNGSEIGFVLSTTVYNRLIADIEVKERILPMNSMDYLADDLLSYMQIAGASERFSFGKENEGEMSYIVASASPEVYVDGTKGDDEKGNGTEDNPFKTYEKAEEALIEKDPEGKTSGYIYVKGTLTVTEEATWPTENWGDRAEPVLMRYDSAVNSKDFTGYMVSISGKETTLTLGEIILDGNKKAFDAKSSLVEVKDGGVLNIQKATLCNNTVSNSNSAMGGGAVYCKGGTVVMSGGTITDNSAQLYGGGIALYENAKMMLSGGIIEKNKLTKQLDTEPAKAGSGFTYKSGTASAGGGIAVLYNAELYMSGGSVINNTSKCDGGGIAIGSSNTATLDNPRFTMTGGIISGNRSEATGGGIFVECTGKATISGGEITNNQVQASVNTKRIAWYGGGGIYVNGGKGNYANGELQLYNVIVTDNSGTGLSACPTSKVEIYLTDGGAIYGNRGSNQLYFEYANKGGKWVISPYMLGGGAYNWTDENGNILSLNELQALQGAVGRNFSLRNAPSSESIGNAKGKAVVWITGNSSEVTGGGIATNGTVKIGTDTAKTSVNAKKDWKGDTSLYKALLKNVNIWLFRQKDGKTEYHGYQELKFDRSYGATRKDEDTFWSGSNEVTFSDLPDDGSTYFVLEEYILKDGTHVWSADGKDYKDVIDGIMKGTPYSWSDEVMSSYKSEITGNQTDGYTITNTLATGVDLVATKRIQKQDATLSELVPNKKAFQFTIKEADANGDPTTGGYTEIKPNDEKGEIHFSFQYTEAGTHYYVISEVDDGTAGESGLTYDKTVYFVTVNVEKSSDGALKATKTIKVKKNGEGDWQPFTGDTMGTMPFVNTYDASGSISLTATKILVGAALTDDQYQFSFKLKALTEGDDALTETDASGKTETVTEKTASNNADGSIDFGELHYTLEGVGNTYEYKITEAGEEGDNKGITYDETVYTVTVGPIEDNGDGSLKIPYKITDSNNRTLGPNDTMTFTNQYHASVDLTLDAKKILNGATLAAEQFSFTLTATDAEGNALTGDDAYSETVTNAADGSITFAPFHYTQEDKNKDYYYTVTEAHGTDEWITYDDTVYRVKVHVTDNGDGTMTAAKTITKDGESDEAVDAMTFTNQYHASGDLTLDATKTLEGAVLENGQFSFTLTATDADGNALIGEGAYSETVTNAADGSITFTPIHYTQENKDEDYYYTVTEVQGTDERVTYDGTVYRVVVHVTDNGDGTMTAAKTITANGVTADAITFTNTYQSEADGSLTLEAAKILNGAALAAGQFSFTLTATDADGNALTGEDAYSETVVNAADGSVSFTPLAYTEEDDGKDYYYTVTEVRGTDAQVTYDGTVYRVAVHVTDNGDGTLTIGKTVTAGGQPAGDMTFTNTYTQQEDGRLTVVKQLTYNDTIYSAADATYYVALYADEALTQRVSDIMPLVYRNSGTASVEFTGLERGGTYYVGETTADGTVINNIGGVTADGTQYSPYFANGTRVVISEDGTSVFYFENVFLELPPEQFYPEGELTVTKQLTYAGEDYGAIDATYYVALFSDEALTDRVSEIMPLVYRNAGSTSVKFGGLEIGKTYYIGETTADGTVLNSIGGVTADGVEYSALFAGGNSAVVNEEGTAAVAFENEFEELPKDYYREGELTITKRLLGADGSAKNSSETFYAGIFADEAHTTLSDQVSQNIVPLNLGGKSFAEAKIKVAIAPGATQTLYVTEVDQNGKPVAGAASFRYDVTVENAVIQMDENVTEGAVTITNKETSPDDSETPETVTTTSVKTGDETPIVPYLIALAAAALVLVILFVIRRRRRAK